MTKLFESYNIYLFILSNLNRVLIFYMFLMILTSYFRNLNMSDKILIFSSKKFYIYLKET